MTILLVGDRHQLLSRCPHIGGAFQHREQNRLPVFLHAIVVAQAIGAKQE
jgi:hypothetical protein